MSSKITWHPAFEEKEASGFVHPLAIFPMSADIVKREQFLRMLYGAEGDLKQARFNRDSDLIAKYQDDIEFCMMRLCRFISPDTPSFEPLTQADVSPPREGPREGPRKGAGKEPTEYERIIDAKMKGVRERSP